ncbi:MAG: hypothetical protein AAFS07_18785 [Pseudomonadota bacterium]
MVKYKHEERNRVDHAIQLTPPRMVRAVDRFLEPVCNYGSVAQCLRTICGTAVPPDALQRRLGAATAAGDIPISFLATDLGVDVRVYDASGQLVQTVRQERPTTHGSRVSASFLRHPDVAKKFAVCGVPWPDDPRDYAPRLRAHLSQQKRWSVFLDQMAAPAPDGSGRVLLLPELGTAPAAVVPAAAVPAPSLEPVVVALRRTVEDALHRAENAEARLAVAQRHAEQLDALQERLGQAERLAAPGGREQADAGERARALQDLQQRLAASEERVACQQEHLETLRRAAAADRDRANRAEARLAEEIAADAHPDRQAYLREIAAVVQSTVADGVQARALSQRTAELEAQLAEVERQRDAGRDMADQLRQTEEEAQRLRAELGAMRDTARSRVALLTDSKDREVAAIRQELADRQAEWERERQALQQPPAAAPARVDVGSTLDDLMRQSGYNRARVDQVRSELLASVQKHQRARGKPPGPRSSSSPPRHRAGAPSVRFA